MNHFLNVAVTQLSSLTTEETQHDVNVLSSSHYEKNITSNIRYGVTNMLSIQTQKIFIIQNIRTIIE